MSRKSIPLNTARQLWAQCGGYCQNPNCNKLLFCTIDDEIVSLVNVAHMVGHGSNGPRSEHELAQYIAKDGIDNLVMLCLECHKIVDEMKRIFSVEDMQGWKTEHARRISALFATPNIGDERELLIQVNDLLDTNATIFKEYGPFSQNVLSGESGDGLRIWRRRCRDTILPNNQRIVQLIERNKSNFPYPWDVYRQMLLYKMHVDAFQDNCLLGQKINDYKLFPREFDHYVKTKLGIQVQPLETRVQEELEYRNGQIKTFIDRFLSNHELIGSLQELNRGTMLVEMRDGRTLKVFVTNTYCFTEYTFDKVMSIDPSINAIICSCPAGTYSDSAKRLCIENDIGLFMLSEFMGAIRKDGEEYLNYLLKAEREDRVGLLKRIIRECKPQAGISVYVFGSYIRRKLHRDIDLMLVYPQPIKVAAVRFLEASLRDNLERRSETSDITVVSSPEFASLKLKHDNLTQVYP